MGWNRAPYTRGFLRAVCWCKVIWCKQMKHQSGGTSALQATENTEWLELFLMSLQRNSSLPVNPKQEAVNVANFLVIAGITWAGVTHGTRGFLHLSCTEMLFHPWFLLLFKEGTTHSSKRATKIHVFAYWWFPKDFKCFNSKIQKYYLFFLLTSKHSWCRFSPRQKEQGPFLGKHLFLSIKTLPWEK